MVNYMKYVQFIYIDIDSTLLWLKEVYLLYFHNDNRMCFPVAIPHTPLSHDYH